MSEVLDGFMADDKWYEDVGHVFIGLVPMWGWWREWVKQLPPENDKYPVMMVSEGRSIEGNYYAEPMINQEYDFMTWGREYWAKPRVLDIGRDEFGYEVGRTIRFIVCIVMIGVNYA